MLRLALVVLALAPQVAVADSGQKIREQELADVRQRIATLRESIDDASRQQARLNGELERAETELKQARETLAGLRRDEAASRERLVELKRETVERETALERETTLLAEQLRSAYRNGRTERLRLLLDAADPRALGRRMAYYGYLNDWRQSSIDDIGDRLKVLADLASQERGEVRRLGELARLRESALTEADAIRDQRERVLGRLEAQIEREGGEVAELERREKDLERLIAELASILADYPIASGEPFSSLRGELTWPVAGQLRHDFGQPRDGGPLTWKGVVLSAERGQEVRALYHGRVAFSDWLPGLGLLTVIDHGDGYLSLYGHNDALLKDVGDWVAAGDTIATVGDSGGRAEPGLYLEIRHGTEALNPRRWISRTPRE